MNRVMVISTCMAVSVEMRCFSLDSRVPASVYHPVALHGRDVAFLVLLALAMVVAVTLPWVRHG
jgi:energy-coupling factor transporter transmembrane protein EcfT